MEIGKLNQRIAVLENHVRKDAIGNHKAQWEEIFSLWASVTVGNTQGSATEEANTGVTREIQRIEVIIRQTPQTKRMSSTAYRIRFENQEYDITGIVPNYNTQDYMKLICESRRAGAKDDFC
ncbi:MAG: head-tail adaptor protein [Oscillospiraceae bacterium]|nr:head-tail adaptor protein [Oscillospiraceae bacterium]